MLMHDCWEVFHFGQEGPRRAIVALFRNLERRQTLAGQAGQRRKHGGADLWLRRGDTMKKSFFFFLNLYEMNMQKQKKSKL